MSELCGFCGQDNPPGTLQCQACGGALVLNLHTLPKGHALLEGRYLVGRVLGEGGFGITYQGTDLTLGRAVAIKEFFPQGSTRLGMALQPAPSYKPEIVQQMLVEFLAEAEKLAQFDHPHIVPVYANFEENQTAYMVMDYLRGQTLEDLVNQDGPLTEARVLLCLQQMGAALEVVHATGLLHRDIKPGNIMMAGEDRAVLIDFGSARAFKEGLTQKQTQIVTAGFAPPEQYALQARRGGFTDVYALAATAYFLLSGQVPVSAMDRLFGNPLPELAGTLNPQLKKAITAGMALRVEERPATMTEFLKLLEPPPEPAPRKLLSIPIWLRPRISQTFHGPRMPIRSLAFQPGGTLLAAAAQDGFFIWESQTGQRYGAIATDESERLLVQFSPDGKALYTASSQGQVTLWDVESKMIYHALSRLATQSQALAFSPDGVFLAIGIEEGQGRLGARSAIKLVALNDGSTYWLFRGHRGPITGLAFSKDGTSLVSSSTDGTVRRWQIGQEQALQTIPIAHSNVQALALHPDQQQCAIGTLEGIVQLWHLGENRLIAQNQQPLAPVIQLDFHPLGYLLGAACSGPEGQWGAGVHLWDVVTSRQRLNNLASPIRQGVTALAITLEGRYLAGGSAEGTVQTLTNG